MASPPKLRDGAPPRTPPRSWRLASGDSVRRWLLTMLVVFGALGCLVLCVGRLGEIFPVFAPVATRVLGCAATIIVAGGTTLWLWPRALVLTLAGDVLTLEGPKGVRVRSGSIAPPGVSARG